MPIEIEKKYRLTKAEADQLIDALTQGAASYAGEEFEENILFAGGALDPSRSVLRLRRVAGRAILTYKERYPSDSAIKHQREDETAIADPEALGNILAALGFKAALVYEKRRQTWRLGNAEIVVDQLPFGWFAEIEGDETAIAAAEAAVGLENTEPEGRTYPELAKQFGRVNEVVIEARFPVERGGSGYTQ